MDTRRAFHLVYLPADVLRGARERVVSLIETDDLADVSLQLVAAPGSIALELYACDRAEAAFELRDLGFA